MIIPRYYPQLLSQRGRVTCRRLSQSDYRSSHSACLTLSPLRSTGITPLHHYYGALRLPVMATIQVIDSLSSLSAFTRHRDGSPKFLTNLSLRASFNHPGWPSGYKFPLKSPLVTGFTISGKLAANKLCNEAESSSLALRLATSLSKGSHPSSRLAKSKPPVCLPDRVTPNRRPQLHVERTINMAGTLQPARLAKLCLAHQSHEDTKE
jgi:hypothetical protein